MPGSLNTCCFRSGLTWRDILRQISLHTWSAWSDPKSVLTFTIPRLLVRAVVLHRVAGGWQGRAGYVDPRVPTIHELGKYFPAQLSSWQRRMTRRRAWILILAFLCSAGANSACSNGLRMRGGCFVCLRFVPKFLFFLFLWGVFCCCCCCWFSPHLWRSCDHEDTCKQWQ